MAQVKKILDGFGEENNSRLERRRRRRRRRLERYLIVLLPRNFAPSHPPILKIVAYPVRFARWKN
jgi:hypothetical protein